MKIPVSSLITFALITLIYSGFTLTYDTIYILTGKYHDSSTILLVPITVMFAVVLVSLKVFLKYYYNFKDSNYYIYYVISFFTLHNIMVFIYTRGVDAESDFGFTFAIVLVMLAIIEIVFNILFALKLQKTARKSKSFYRLFAYSYTFIPIGIVLNYIMVYFQGESLMGYLTAPNSNFAFALMRITPFLILTYTFYKAKDKRNKKKYKPVPLEEISNPNIHSGHSSFK